MNQPERQRATAGQFYDSMGINASYLGRSQALQIERMARVMRI